MKKLFAIALLLAFNASAATVYKDRYVPISTGPCMVEFGELNFNASLISSLNVGVYTEAYRSENVRWHQQFTGDVWSTREYFALRIVLANSKYFEIRGVGVEELNMKKLGLLKTIKDTCK